MTMTHERISTITIRRSHERFHTRTSWLDSRHSFSFAGHYDPANTHHGLLLVSNDDVIKAGTGFQTHPHQDMEIITWVLSGELEHQDSVGNTGIIYRCSQADRGRHTPIDGRHHRQRRSHRLGDALNPNPSDRRNHEGSLSDR